MPPEVPPEVPPEAPPEFNPAPSLASISELVSSRQPLLSLTIQMEPAAVAQARIGELHTGSDSLGF